MNLTDLFPQDILDSVQSHILSDTSIEQCGLIVKDSENNFLVINSKNLATQPKINFQISPLTLKEAESKGLPVAIYHSHISDLQSGYLSEVDVKNSKSSKLPSLLYHIQFDTWDYFDPTLTENPYPLTLSGNYKALEHYLNWIWEWDRSDCWSLVRAYYKGILEIELEDYPRPSLREIYKNGWNAFDENLPARGFQKVYDKPRKNDLVLLRIQGDNPHHIAVMLDSEKFLHLYDKNTPSRVDLLGGFEMNLVSVWRFNC